MNNDPIAPPSWPEPRQPLFGRTGRRIATAATAVGLMTGAFAGGFIVTHAATAATTPSASAATTIPSTSGTFHSNENATHEAGESAAREAQENAGQFPAVP